VDAVDLLSARRVTRPAEVVELAAAAGLDLACAATLLEKESGGGRNVWGHDPVRTGGLYRKGGEVTREAYLAYKARRAELGAQGVGPCQLTWRGYQDEADRRGGCWDWRVNVAVGFETLAGLIRAHGVRGGFRRYNGSGPMAEKYADDAMEKLARWRDRFGRAAPSPSPDPVLRLGSRGPAVAELQRVLNAWYPNDVRIAVDGVFGPATEAAVRLCQSLAGITVDGVVGPQTRRVLHL
jgi:putative peptidoglycan binding protein